MGEAFDVVIPRQLTHPERTGRTLAWGASQRNEKEQSRLQHGSFVLIHN
jgi:hypothetical protein